METYWPDGYTPLAIRVHLGNVGDLSRCWSIRVYRVEISRLTSNPVESNPIQHCSSSTDTYVFLAPQKPSSSRRYLPFRQTDRQGDTETQRQYPSSTRPPFLLFIFDFRLSTFNYHRQVKRSGRAEEGMKKEGGRESERFCLSLSI
jgi:hypothetical protein